MSLVFLILILIVHGLIYVLMNQTYAAEKQLLAEKNLEELRVRISEKPADQIREICEKFAISPGLQKNSISICSNSLILKMKFPGVISFLKALPI